MLEDGVEGRSCMDGQSPHQLGKLAVKIGEMEQGLIVQQGKAE